MMIKEISGFPGYYATTSGQISGRRVVWLKPVTIMGYQCVALYHEKKGHIKKIHRLVLETFIGPCPVGQECRHLDGNAKNNNLDNLCWGTKEENTADLFKHGKICRGECCSFAKLTEQKVKEIRNLYSTGQYTQAWLAKAYKTAQTNISSIVTRKTWTLC